MSTLPIRRALISVHDKTGVVEFARALVDRFDTTIVSTGGTARLLAEAGLKVTAVESLTGIPEMLDGRVKTLHPAVHAPILADRSNPEHVATLQRHAYGPIDLVAVNLYPFARAVADPAASPQDIIEMIDIGGPCLLRAAAKNHAHVVVVPGPESIPVVMADLNAHGAVTAATRKRLAAAAFGLVSAYDERIAAYLASVKDAARSARRSWVGTRVAELRYGENPQQTAALYADVAAPSEPSLVRADCQPGDAAVSFNNYTDGHAALELCRDLDRATPDAAAAVFIKHANPCGAGLAPDPVAAFAKAYLGDPLAAMGGVLAMNRPVDAACADAVMHALDRWGRDAGAGAFFVEVWIAPAFEAAALDILRQAKPWGRRTRVFAVGALTPVPAQAHELRAITGGWLLQDRDLGGIADEDWEVVTRRVPTAAERRDLEFAWITAKHTRSNAITVARDSQIIGNGAGQMSRVMSCRIACDLARDNGHAERLVGSVAASDAFFPFADGPEILIAAGVRAIVQPGGSKRDGESVDLCDRHGVAMVHSGTRHFRH